MTVVRDHRTKSTSTRPRADLPIRRGTYDTAKRRQLGAARSRRVRGVGQLAGIQTRTPASSVTTVGTQPAGFGMSISWVGEEDLAVVAFVSAADSLGLGINGVTDGDTIQFFSATGLATFSQDSHNEFVGSIATIVAAGASLGAAAFGQPELAPFITAAGASIAKAFPESKSPSMGRDAYGQMAGSDEFARAEGGLLVCSPTVQGVYYSGDRDHQDRWIRSGKDRKNEHRPPHVRDAFFLRRGTGRTMLRGDGTLVICPWDWKFEDNIGAYKVEFILRRGEPPVVVVD